MQGETPQICAVVLLGQTSEYQITLAMEQERGMTGVKEGWMDGGRGNAAEINVAKAQSAWGKLRMGHHVNLNPFRERGKHTGRENKALSWKEGCEIFVFLPSPFIPLVCDQPVSGSSWEIPLYLSEASHLITAFLALPAVSPSLPFLIPLFLMSLSQTPVFGTSHFNLTHPSTIRFSRSAFSSFQLFCQ